MLCFLSSYRWQQFISKYITVFMCKNHGQVGGRDRDDSLNNKTWYHPVNSGFSFKVYGSQVLPDLFPVVFTWMVALLPSPFAQSFPTSVWHFIVYYLWGLCKCSLSSAELWICGAARKVLGSEEYKTTLLIAPKALPFSKVNKCVCIL